MPVERSQKQGARRFILCRGGLRTVLVKGKFVTSVSTLILGVTLYKTKRAVREPPLRISLDFNIVFILPILVNIFCGQVVPLSTVGTCKPCPYKFSSEGDQQVRPYEIPSDSRSFPKKRGYRWMVCR